LPIGPHFGAVLAASFADEPRLQIGKPDVMRPSVAAHCRHVTAAKIGTVDQQAANATGAHFGKGDFLRAGSGIPHDCADRAGSEAAGYWAVATMAHKARGRATRSLQSPAQITTMHS